MITSIASVLSRAASSSLLSTSGRQTWTLLQRRPEKAPVLCISWLNGSSTVEGTRWNDRRFNTSKDVAEKECPFIRPRQSTVARLLPRPPLTSLFHSLDSGEHVDSTGRQSQVSPKRHRWTPCGTSPKRERVEYTTIRQGSTIEGNPICGLDPVLQQSIPILGTKLSNGDPFIHGILPSSLPLPPSGESVLKELTGEVQFVGPKVPVYSSSYSIVRKAVWKNRQVAVKIINTMVSSKKTFRKFRRESTIWAKLQHPNVLPLLGVCLGDDFGLYGALVSPWCTHGNSSDYLAKLSNKPEDRIRLLIEVARGVHYLHTHKPIVIHGDLKPANILVDAHGTAKLCDFGLIRILQEEIDTGLTTSTPHTGTARYLSREIVIGDELKPTMASDCYAFGCLVLEFAYGIRPYADRKVVATIYTDITRYLRPYAFSLRVIIKESGNCGG